MVCIKRIKELGAQYDRMLESDEPDYIGNHRKLCVMVDHYGTEAVAVATNLKESTVRQHYRNKNPGTAMVSDRSIARAEAIFKEL